MCTVCVQLPVWPATVNRLRPPILYGVHGCSCRSACPRLCYLQYNKNLHLHWSSEILCSPTQQYALQAPRSLLLCQWERVAMSHPGEWQLPVLMQTEVGRLGAVTMTSYFRQRTRIQVYKTQTEIDLSTAKSELSMILLELAKLIKTDQHPGWRSRQCESVYVWYKVLHFQWLEIFLKLSFRLVAIT